MEGFNERITFKLKNKFKVISFFNFTRILNSVRKLNTLNIIILNFKVFH